LPTLSLSLSHISLFFLIFAVEGIICSNSDDYSLSFQVETDKISSMVRDDNSLSLSHSHERRGMELAKPLCLNA
jgi:hypothetical protein